MTFQQAVRVVKVGSIFKAGSFVLRKGNSKSEMFLQKYYSRSIQVILVGLRDLFCEVL